MKRHLTEEELIEHKFKLAPDERAAGLAEHLAGCAECRERLELLSQKFAALDLLAEDVTASEELISQAVAQARKPVSRKVVWFGKYHWLGTAAAAVLLLGLTLFFGNPDKQAAPPREVAQTPKSESVSQYSHPALRNEVAEKEKVTLLTKELTDRKDEALVEVTDGMQLAARSAPTHPPVDTEAGGSSTFYGTSGTARNSAPADSRQYAFAPPQGPTPTAGEGAVSTSALEPTLKSEQDSFNVLSENMPAYDVALGGLGGGRQAGGEIAEQPPFAPASAIELVTLPRRDNVQLTIYNSTDLTLVREKRNLTLKHGWNWLQLMWANTLIDPTSLSLEPVAQGDKIDVQQLVFPARLRELGRWLIRSEISGQVPFEITYFTSGLSWRAFYMGTLSQDEKNMRLQSYVRVANNSGEDYENAQTRLLVGKVNLLDQIADLAKRQYAYDRPGGPVEGESEVRLGDKGGEFSKVVTYYWTDQVAELNGAFDAFSILKPKEIKKEGLSEYFLYTIEGTETIPDKWGKRLPSFDVEDVNVESLYKYDEERWGNQTIRFVSFANDGEHNLGDTPIPDGNVKIYAQAGDQGALSYVGGANIKYIPVGEEVELNLGPARLVEVEPKLMEFKTDNYVFDSNDNVAGWDEVRDWRMEVTNTRALPVEVEITRGFGTPYWTLQTDATYEKHDATHARFETQLQPRSKQTVSYVLTTYHGRRQEQASQ